MARSKLMTKAPSAASVKRGARKPLPFSYLALYRATAFERIGMIKQGIRATEAKRIFADLAIGQGAALKALKISPATINKKAKQDETLSLDESERVIGIAKLVGQLQAMIEESGDPQGFDAAAWLSQWIMDPLPAIGGARPVDLMDTMEGQALVSKVLSQVQTGAYA